MDLQVVYEQLDRCVLVGNGKGGVGKTALSANLGYAARGFGLNVLLVDLDSQANLAEELGLTDSEHDDDGANLAAALTGAGELTPRPTGRDGLSLVFGGVALRGADRHLTVLSALRQGTQADPGFDSGLAYQALAGPLSRIAADYDLIVIDSPPGSATLLQTGLGAARWLVVPARDDECSRKGLRLIGADAAAAQRAGAQVDPLAVVLFGSPANATAKRRTAIENLRGDLRGETPVLDSTIRASTQATTARYLGLSAGELADAMSALPMFHKLKRLDPDSVSIPLPDTPTIRGLSKERLLDLLKGGSGNVAGLSADYEAVANELFKMIAELEAEQAMLVQEVR